MSSLIMQTTLYINYATGHFRVLRALTIKTRLSAKLCCENEFYFHDNKKQFSYQWLHNEPHFGTEA